MPVGMTVTLDITADDVAHSWWIPKLGGKFDAIPGYTNKTWFKALAARRLPAASAPSCAAATTPTCSRRCAPSPSAEYRRWYDQQAADIQAARDAAAAQREQLERPGRPDPSDPGTPCHVADQSPSRPRPPRPEIIAHEARPEPKGWTSWITTTDHKRIGIMYLWTVAVFFILGGVEALLMRVQLGAPDNTFLEPETYNQLFTMHGTTMIFLVVVPIWAGFANYLLPLMIGARDVAFPRLNAWSFWMFLFGGLTLYASLFFTPPEAGWFSYVPLSSRGVLAVERPGRLDLHGPPHRPLVADRRGQLRRDDPQHARAGHGLGPPAAVHLDDPHLRLPGPAGALRRSRPPRRCC